LGNLLALQNELLDETYKPKQLKTFILREPKTRNISVSDFTDRIVHHALCNIIEPIFDKSFIHDSYANRLGKGTHKAIERFDYFKRKVSKNNTKKCHILKCDIKKYFDSVNHKILTDIIKKKIKDEKTIRLIELILENHSSKNSKNSGMPLGNLTSQFFANVYLNELDQYIKHKLKIKYYIRYVDDFIIMHDTKDNLKSYKIKIDMFLQSKLKIELHKEKSKIRLLNQGISFLGFRIFYFHKLLKKNNLKHMWKNMLICKKKYARKQASYDEIYLKFDGWIAYAKNANTSKIINKIQNKFHNLFNYQIASIEIYRWIKITNNTVSSIKYLQ
jgi:retron-type reverse transcriptase